MKRALKNCGRFFVNLSRKPLKGIKQNVLLVDGSLILPNNFALIIQSVGDKFKNADITVLTFKEKKEFIRDNFPGVEIIIPQGNIAKSKHRLAFQLFFLLLRRRFGVIVLSSLDISLVAVSLTLSRCPAFLRNKWLEWYQIRQRTVLDILLARKSADKNHGRRSGINNVLKSFGRIFVILPEIKEEDLKYRILIVDNGYTDIGHVSTAVRRSLENFINPDITILTFSQRRHHFNDMFPQAKVIVVGKEGRYGLAIQMFGMCKSKLNCIVLTTLDISPIIISLLFLRAEVLLYNRWHEWWVINIKGLGSYIKRFLSFLLFIPVAVYLLFSSAFILFRTALRMNLKNLLSIITKGKEDRYEQY